MLWNSMNYTEQQDFSFLDESTANIKKALLDGFIQSADPYLAFSELIINTNP